ncbi:MAG: hypothetical protein HY537_00665 [Deltaproteobacteria bacterium]|nr:hypothetical protein [Deltaproteobacteria bacterium]
MKKLIFSLVALLTIHCYAETATSKKHSRSSAGKAAAPVMAETEAATSIRQLVVSGGVGQTFLFFPVANLTSQFEIAIGEKFFVGMLVNFGGDPIVTTISVTGRMHLSSHPTLKPSAEVGAGIAIANRDKWFNLIAMSDGVAPMGHIGLGLDYYLQPNFSIGTIARVHLAPAVKTLFFTWPILNIRFTL